MAHHQDLYSEDGVNVKEGDDFSAFAGEICRSTFNNSPFVNVLDFGSNHFRGPKAYCFKSLPEGIAQDVAPDGIGTKVVAIDAAFFHRLASRDLIAMTGGDITRWGGKPLIFVNVLDVSTLGERESATNKSFREMFRGLCDVAHEQEIVCFRGETAELGKCVGSENPDAITKFNWAGFMIGVYLPDRMIVGDTLAPGQAIVALYESGLRSNGHSSVRKALRLHFGDNWWNNPNAKESVQAAAQPSALYDKFLADMNGWTCPISEPRFNFHLITHVTGGGIVGKFAEDILFPRGLSAVLNNLIEPPEIVKNVAKWRDMPDEECYRTFNCGNGALVVLDQGEVSDFIGEAYENGIAAQQCGEITSEKEKPSLVINSGFSQTILEYQSRV